MNAGSAQQSKSKVVGSSRNYRIQKKSPKRTKTTRRGESGPCDHMKTYLRPRGGARELKRKSSLGCGKKRRNKECRHGQRQGSFGAKKGGGRVKRPSLLKVRMIRFSRKLPIGGGRARVEYTVLKQRK